MLDPVRRRPDRMNRIERIDAYRTGQEDEAFKIS